MQSGVQCGCPSEAERRSATSSLRIDSAEQFACFRWLSELQHLSRESGAQNLALGASPTLRNSLEIPSPDRPDRGGRDAFTDTRGECGSVAALRLDIARIKFLGLTPKAKLWSPLSRLNIRSSGFANC